jgi:hypothetical protein
VAGTRDGLPVVVNGVRYETDVESITWRTVPPTREGSDQGAGPGEQSLSMENVWRRTRDSWHLGAGQEYADLLADIDPDVQRLRFRTSDGVNVWDKRAIKPLPTVENKRASVNTNLRTLSMRVAGTDYLVVVDGTGILYASNPTVAGPTFTAHTGLAGTFTDITTDGQKWWACNGTDVYHGVPGTAAATVFSTQDIDVLGYANGRLLAAKTNVLYELSSLGVATVIWTHPNAGFVWTGIVPSPAGIYVFGELGDTSEVYVVTAIDTTGGLDVPFVVAPWPQGERINAMCSYAGVMIIATTRGIRVALITGGGFLSYGPLIDEPGDVRCLEAQLEDVWFGWTQSVTLNGLGRLRLSRFVEELVPAFATDLAARGTVSGTVSSVCTVGTRRYFAIGGRGFYGETAVYEPIGTLDMGWFDYGISEDKLLDSLSVWTDGLPTGCSLVANVYPDNSTDSILTLTMSTANQVKETKTYTGSTNTERLRVVLTLNQSGLTLLTVRRVTLRASPKAFVSQVITLPLYLSDEVQASRSGAKIGMKPYEEWVALEALVKSRTRFTLSVGSWSAPVRMEALEVEKGGLGGGNGLEGWADLGKFMGGKWETTFMTLEPDAEQQGTSNPSMLTGSIAWWLADDASPVGTDQPVTTWTDRISGWSAVSSSTKRPLYKPTGIGGQPALLFDGSNDLIEYVAPSAVSTQETGHVFAVVMATSLANDATIWGTWDTASSQNFLHGQLVPLSGLDRLTFYANQAGSVQTVWADGNIDNAIGLPHLIEWSSDNSANNVIRYDGVSVVNSSTTTRWFADIANRDNFTIGAMKRNVEQEWFAGYVAMVLVTNGVMSAADRTALYTYVTGRYGITITP